MEVVEDVVVRSLFIHRERPHRCHGDRDELEDKHHVATALKGRGRQVVDEDEAQEEHQRLDDVRAVRAHATRIRDLRSENTTDDERQRAVEGRTHQTNPRVDEE